MILVIDYILVLAGILFLLFGSYFVVKQIKIINKIYQITKDKKIRFVIFTLNLLVLLILFFIAGYSIQIYLIDPDFDILFFLNKNFKLWIATHHETLISLVYFGGSIFVLILTAIFYIYLKQLLNVSYSQDYLKTIIDSSYNYIIITDENYNIKEVNETFLRRFQIPKEELVDKNIFSIMSFNQNNLNYGDFFPYICSLNNQDRYVNCSVSELTIYGIHKGYLFSASDITELMNVKKQIELERDILKKFFSPNIIENILKISNDLAKQEILKSNKNDEQKKQNILEGTISKGVIIFIDIRNSTFLSMNLIPEEFTKILNDYIKIIVEKILDCGGTVNKILGDGLLITYEKENYEPLLNCIYEILKDYREKKFHPLIEFGISVHYGKYYRGIIGNDYLLEYTILGEDVNLTAKLQNLNKKLKTTLLITEDFIRLLPEELIKKYSLIHVKTIQWKYKKDDIFHLYSMDESILQNKEKTQELKIQI